MKERDKQLIEVTLDLFQEQGAKFKMVDVAQRMKMSKKTIYKEYGNKEDLIIMIVKATFEGIEHQLEKVMASDTYDSVEKLIRLSCAFPDAKDIDYHKALMLKEDFPKPYHMFIEYIEDNWNLSKVLFEEAKAEGKIKDLDHDVFRVMILGITKQVLDMVDVDQASLLETCVRQVFEGILVKD